MQVTFPSFRTRRRARRPKTFTSFFIHFPSSRDATSPARPLISPLMSPRKSLLRTSRRRLRYANRNAAPPRPAAACVRYVRARHDCESGLNGANRDPASTPRHRYRSTGVGTPTSITGASPGKRAPQLDRARARENASLHPF